MLVEVPGDCITPKRTLSGELDDYLDSQGHPLLPMINIQQNFQNTARHAVSLLALAKVLVYC